MAESRENRAETGTAREETRAGTVAPAMEEGSAGREQERARDDRPPPTMDIVCRKRAPRAVPVNKAWAKGPPTGGLVGGTMRRR